MKKLESTRSSETDARFDWTRAKRGRLAGRAAKVSALLRILDVDLAARFPTRGRSTKRCAHSSRSKTECRGAGALATGRVTVNRRLGADIRGATDAGRRTACDARRTTCITHPTTCDVHPTTSVARRRTTNARPRTSNALPTTPERTSGGAVALVTRPMEDVGAPDGVVPRPSPSVGRPPTSIATRPCPARRACSGGLARTAAVRKRSDDDHRRSSTERRIVRRSSQVVRRASAAGPRVQTVRGRSASDGGRLAPVVGRAMAVSRLGGAADPDRPRTRARPSGRTHGDAGDVYESDAQLLVSHTTACGADG